MLRVYYISFHSTPECFHRWFILLFYLYQELHWIMMLEEGKAGGMETCRGWKCSTSSLNLFIRSHQWWSYRNEIGCKCFILWIPSWLIWYVPRNLSRYRACADGFAFGTATKIVNLWLLFSRCYLYVLLKWNGITSRYILAFTALSNST